MAHDDFDRLWAEVLRIRDRLHSLGSTVMALQIRSEEHGRRIRRLEGAGARRWSTWQRLVALVIVAGGFVLALLHALGVTP